MKLFIGNKNYSSWSMRPWVLMRHAQIPFEEVMVRFDSFAADSQFKRTLAGLSPTGKVPVLQTEIDGRVQVIWDTLAIAEHLAERYPDRHLWPESRAARARARSVTAEMHAGFTALRRHFPLNVEARLPAIGERILAQEAAVVADVARLEELWDECLAISGGPFLFGTFGVADAFHAPVASRLRTYGVPLHSSGEGYVARLMQARGVAEWVVGALAEKDFREFEEPYRKNPEATGAAQGRSPTRR